MHFDRAMYDGSREFRGATQLVKSRRLALVAAMGAVLSLLLGFIALRSAEHIDRVFPGFLCWDNGMLVSIHASGWTGRAAGLPLNGGRIVAIDGAPFRGGAELIAYARGRGTGAVITYRVRAEGRERDVPVATMRFDRAGYFATLGNYLLNAAALFAIALVALYLRPDRAEARALFCSTAALGVLVALSVDFVSTYALIPLYPFAEGLTPAAAAYFALVFPAERLEPRRRRALVGSLAALGIAAGAAELALFRRDPELSRALSAGTYLCIAAIGLGMLASVGHALLRAHGTDARMRAAVVFTGGIVAFLLPALAIPLFFLFGWSFSSSWLTAAFFLYPLSMLYAVVRYDLFDVERLIRLTVGYGFATSAVVIVYAVVLFGLERLASPVVSHSSATSFALLIGIALLFDPLRQRAQLAVDRLFFRSTADVARVLEESGADLAEIGDEEAIARHVGRRLREVLALEWAELRRESGPRAGSVIVEPVSFRGESLGSLCCGAKRSGAPFSHAERDLVRGMAAQAALALRNVKSIRELALAQAALLRTERLAAIGEFAGAVAHGIRNPLSGIRAAAQIAHEQSFGKQAENLANVLSEADRLEQRIRTLLDFSRSFDPTPRQTQVAELLAAVRASLLPRAERQGAAIQLRCSDAVGSLETDADYLEEVLLELAGNALNAMPNGGTLCLDADRIGGRVVLRVTDTGKGIPQAVQARIFDLFFTTRHEGTGMGLATVRKIVERLGGSIELESSSHAGSSFRIEL
jgi:signal transduction histidine kinase